MRFDDLDHDTDVEEIEEPKENDEGEDWKEADSNLLVALQASNKDGTLTIAGLDNTELSNEQ